MSTRPDLKQPWQPPQLVPELTEADSTTTPSTPQLGGLVMIVASNRSPPGYDLYETRRADTQSPCGDLVALTALNSPAHESSPFLSVDGLTLWWSSNRAGSGEYDLYMSRRATVEDPFTEIVSVEELNGAVSTEGDPWVSDDGREIYFLSSAPDPPGVEYYDIFHATR